MYIGERETWLIFRQRTTRDDRRRLDAIVHRAGKALSDGDDSLRLRSDYARAVVCREKLVDDEISSRVRASSNN